MMIRPCTRHFARQGSCLLAALLALSFQACTADEISETGSNVTAGGPSIEKSDAIEYISDISWLKDYFSLLDQASIPWIMGSILFTETIAGTSGIPVIFDAAAAPALTVDLKIEVAGSEQLGTRAPVTIYENAEVPLQPMRLSAFIDIDGQTAEYEKVPESVPYVGGKTIIPMYYLITLPEYDWATAGDTTKEQFSSAFDEGNLATVTSDAPDNVPVPWLDCETVKVTMKYKGTATEEGKYQLESVKYLAADPKVTIELLEKLAEGAGPALQEQTGFDITKVVSALNSVDVPTCTAPTDEEIARFDVAE